MQRFLRLLLRSKIRFVLLGAVILAAFVWLVFFDSHSITRRVSWTDEKDKLELENAELQSRIEDMDSQVLRADSSEVIEERAREDYGMRREGETIYRLEKKKDDN